MNLKVLALASSLIVASTLSPAQKLVAHLLAPSSSTSLCQKPCKASDGAIALIQHFEGFSPFAYYDSAGYKTIGMGHLIRPGEQFREPMTGQEAQTLLERDLRPVEEGINRLLVRPIKQNQFDALGSFSFNLGVGTLKKSTLLKYVNGHKDDDVPPQFLRYVNAGGRKISGLQVRRAAEADLYAGN